jgi:hypothetical protein
MSNSTVASNTMPTAEEASLDDDAPLECDTTTPVIPINLISHLVLPFVQDRPTWNAVCSANKELHEAGMRMKTLRGLLKQNSNWDKMWQS